MKNILYILGFAAGVALTVVSCEEDSTVLSSSVSLPSASVIVPYTGGSVSVRYGIGNAKEGGYMLASSEDDWLSDFDFSVTDTLTFLVAEHFERKSRYGSIRLMYMLEADTLASNTLSVSQEYNSYYVFDAPYASGEYYGLTNHYNNESIMQYSLYLSDVRMDEYGTFTEGSTYYFLDLWSNAAVNGISYVTLPAGDYGFGQVGNNWTLSSESRFFVTDSEDVNEAYSDGDYFVDGELNVTRSGDITTITGVLEDFSGGTHEISYSGELTLENMGIISTLEGDEAVGDISDVDCEARYYGDYYQTGTANWLLCIYPETGSGFIIDIVAEASYDMDGGVPVGTFPVSYENGDEGTFIRGYVFNHFLAGTWYLTLDEEGALTSPYAPISRGTVVVSASGDSYTVTIDGYDDREYNITGTWTGTPTVSDYRTAVTSLSANRSGILKLR